MKIVLKTLFTSLTVLSLFAATPALADRYKQLSSNIDAADFIELEIEVSIGELDVEIYEGDTIELEIELEAQRRWFGLRRGNVEDLELEQRASGDALYLGIDEDEVEQEWRMRVPTHLVLDIAMGVGDAHISGLDNHLRMELGVGAARVDVEDADRFGRIQLEAGVGDATIRGFGRGADNERSNLVGADADYVGDGEFDIDLEVGVGEAQVRAR